LRERSYGKGQGAEEHHIFEANRAVPTIPGQVLRIPDLA